MILIVVDWLVNTEGRVGCRLVLELQHTNGMHAESFSRKVRSLCGLSHWKNVIHLSGVVLLSKVVARGNQGSMGRRIPSGTLYRRKPISSSKIPFPMLFHIPDSL